MAIIEDFKTESFVLRLNDLGRVFDIPQLENELSGLKLKMDDPDF